MSDVFCREGIEWGNTWFEKANRADMKRFAMLGDSVTRGIRGRLNELCMQNEIAVDLCASSSQVTDSMSEKQIRFFFEVSEYKYQSVILQWGGQHGFFRRCSDDEEYRKIFKSGYENLVRVISEYCSNIYFLSATPTVLKEDLITPDEKRNIEIAERNRIVEEVCREYSGKYIDIYSGLTEKSVVHTDYIHFDRAANEGIAQLIYESIVRIGSI
ncbi:MAG: SGNH/GDSL hydrolase family protein [Lachnospiraceae bacterium]|nr:SGNH/GDSL hydrolase family protein [Lachnospiraceae bacterium]